MEERKKKKKENHNFCACKSSYSRKQNNVHHNMGLALLEWSPAQWNNVRHSEYAKSNKALYNICNVNNSQTFFLPCSLCENRWFIQLYFKNSIFTEPQLDPLYKVACLAHISML